MNRYKCVICKQEEFGHGNNPNPISDYGKCCDLCNLNIVLPLRIKKLNKVIRKKVKKQGGVKPTTTYKDIYIYIGIISAMFFIALYIIK